MTKKLLFTPDGSVPVFLDPVIAQLGGLNEEQVKAGCAVNMFPPYRPECHATGKENVIYIEATTDLDPYGDVECEMNSRRIPHCYVTSGGRTPHIDQTDPLEDPQQPSEDPSPTSIPTLSSSNETGDRGSHDVPYTKETSSGQTETVASSHPSPSVPPTSSPSPTTPSSGPSTSASHTSPSEDYPMIPSSRPSAAVTSTPTSTTTPSTPTHSSTITPSGTTSPSSSTSLRPTDSPSSGANKASETSIAPSPKPSSAKPEVAVAPSSKPEGEKVPSSWPEVEVAPSSKPEGEKVPSSWPEVEGVPSSWPQIEKVPSSWPEAEEVPSSKPKMEKVPSSWPEAEKRPYSRPEVEIAPPWEPSTPSETSPPGSSKPSLITADGIPPEELDHHLTVMVEALGPKDKDKDKKHLALGLSIGLGAGIPSAGCFRWLGTFFRTLGRVAKGGNVHTSVMRALTNFKMDMIPHFNFGPPGRSGAPGRHGGGTPASEVAESVDEWYDDLCRNGNTGEQAAEIINNFKADMAAAEAAMAGEAVENDAAVNAAAGRAFTNPSVLNSWGVQAAAQVASTPGAGIEEIADSLLKAGVPAEAVESTAEAVSHSVNTAGKGWIGRPAYNAALGVISSSVTSAGMAGAEAAKAAVKGASGPGLAASLGAAGVPASAADATAAAVNEAIQAAQASGSDPVTEAIKVISKAASTAGLAAGAAWDGASGSSLGPALSAAGVPTDALGATAAAVGAAVSANKGSRSAAMNAASDIIASAASLPYERMSDPAPPVSPAQAALDVVGASFNFWHIIPWLAWDTLNKIEANQTDSSDMDDLAILLAIGPPPLEWSSRFTSFPYRRGGNRVTGVPALPIDEVRPTPSSTHNGTHNGTHNSTHNDTQSSTPTLKPAPPGTGGYLYDGTKPTPSTRG